MDHTRIKCHIIKCHTSLLIPTLLLLAPTFFILRFIKAIFLTLYYIKKIPKEPAKTYKAVPLQSKAVNPKTAQSVTKVDTPVRPPVKFIPFIEVDIDTTKYAVYTLTTDESDPNPNNPNYTCAHQQETYPRTLLLKKYFNNLPQKLQELLKNINADRYTGKIRETTERTTESFDFYTNLFANTTTGTIIETSLISDIDFNNSIRLNQPINEFYVLYTNIHISRYSIFPIGIQKLYKPAFNGQTGLISHFSLDTDKLPKS